MARITSRQYPIALFLVLHLLLASCAHSPTTFSEVEWRQEVEKESSEMLHATHFEDGKYFNPWMPMGEKTFMRLLKWMMSPEIKYTDEEQSFKPALIPNLKERIESMPEGDFIAWIGHTTFLIRLRGEYFLTDPVLFEWAFVLKRQTPAAITAEEVNDIAPKVNILISHNHYDHLDTKSIEALSDSARVIVPKGLKDIVEDMYKDDVTEMDWWQTIDIGNEIKIVCLPAQHWSRRLNQEINTTLWVSYMIITPETTIYFGADSGYFLGYREIGRVYPNITYALMPTAASHPRWFMHYSHMNVPEALDSFKDLGAQNFIPMHWGTFSLGDEPVGYAAIELKRKIKELHLDPSRFFIMDLGQIIPVENKRIITERRQ